MTPLRTEDLKHKIVLRRPIQVSNGKGGYTTSWTTLAQPRAEVLGLDGRESVMDHVLQGISVYRIRIRWRAGLSLQPSDQAKFNGIDLNVRSAVDPDGRREQLVIMADNGSARTDG